MFLTVMPGESEALFQYLIKIIGEKMLHEYVHVSAGVWRPEQRKLICCLHFPEPFSLQRSSSSCLFGGATFRFYGERKPGAMFTFQRIIKHLRAKASLFSEGEGGSIWFI